MEASGAGWGTDPRTWFDADDGPWVERSGFRDDRRYREASDEQRTLADAFHRDGVIVLPGAVSMPRCRQIVEATAPFLASSGPDRRTNAWWALEPVRDLALLSSVSAAIEFLYGRTPIPFQTLNFRTGTEQDPHRDEVHFDSLPGGFMCGAWVALEDVGLGQGPVSYWPGSQGGANGDAEVPFTCHAGDVLVWSASVLHGGMPITESGSTRWSQVTHYFFEGCTWYTPMHSDVGEGRLQLRRPLVDIGTRRAVRPQLRGQPARFVREPDGRHRLLAPDEPDLPLAQRLAQWGHDAVPAASRRVRSAAARVLRRPPRG